MHFSFMFSSVARIIESFVAVFAWVRLLTGVGEQVFLMMLLGVGNFATNSADFIISCHQCQVRRSLRSVNITNCLVLRTPRNKLKNIFINPRPVILLYVLNSVSPYLPELRHGSILQRHSPGGNLHTPLLPQCLHCRLHSCCDHLRQCQHSR